MNTMSKYAFYYAMIASSFAVMSSTSWMGAWLMLEVNLISFIFIMFSCNTMNLKDSPIIYFITQAIASILFLLMFNLMAYYINYQYFFAEYIDVLAVSIPLLMKIGSSPFHFWLPLVMKNLGWMVNYLLMTWQKVAPLSLMFHLIDSTYVPFIILSLFVGAIYGLNQSSLKLMMAFSSINQVAWMLYALMLSKMLFIFYMMLYSIILLNVVLFFHLFKLNYLNQLTNLYLSKYTKMMIAFNVLSLGGMPPFLGFFPKLLMVIAFNNHPLIMLMMMVSLITLFFYLRILIMASMYMSMKMNLVKSDNANNYLLMFTSWLTKFSFILLILI